LPTAWAWDFTNDGTTDSTQQNPTYTYSMPGTYSVKLTAANAYGNNSITKTNYIQVSLTPPPPVADFIASPTSGVNPLTVNFTDQSTNSPTSWAWDFTNDGTTDSTAQNPSYTYSNPGSYTVKLTASNAYGSDSKTRTNYIQVNIPAPVTDFIGSPTSGTRPLTVNFTDQSTNSPTSWAWDFTNDGTTDSTAQNPSYTYQNAGTYSVKLTATNSTGSDTKTRTSYISVAAAPLTMVYDIPSPSAGIVVYLTTNSSCVIDWGDGTSTNTVLPGMTSVSHTYALAGEYTVRISGSVYQLGGGAGTGSGFRLKRILNWGDVGLVSLSGACGGANILESIPNYIPSTVTDLSYMFYLSPTFNLDISGWDTTNVTNMQYMFRSAAQFNQPLNSWNTANVTNMTAMFYGAASFNQNLNSWNTGNVTIMAQMFYQATSFNGQVSTWNVSKVTDMTQMFAGASTFNQNISSWNIGNVTDLTQMFQSASVFNQNINSWNTSKVTRMIGVFQSATVFNQPLSNWNTSLVTNMSNMFSNAIAFNQDISLWNTSNVTNMTGMFSYTNNFNQEIGSWNTSNVTELTSMFDNALVFNKNIGSWDVSKVTRYNYLFLGAAAFNQNINSWDTSNVTEMYAVFNGAVQFNQPLDSWDVSKVTNMGLMFKNATAFNQDLSSWCVTLIPTKPTDFDSGAGAWVLPNSRPIWGTCPATYTTIMHVPGTGTPGSTIFTDLVPGNTWGILSGTPSIVASPSKFGGGSLYSPSPSVIRLTSPKQSFKLDGDYTIEGWLYNDGSSSAGTVVYLVDAMTGSGSNDLRIDICPFGSNSSIRHACGDFSVSVSTDDGSIFNRWVHVFAGRQGNIIYAGINGKVASQSNVTNTALVPSSVYLNSLASTAPPSAQYVNEVRILLGACLYTSNYIPPTTPF
jgi:surface protein